VRVEKMTNVARWQVLERSGACSSESHYDDPEGNRDDEWSQRDKLLVWPQVSGDGYPQR
jgi:hypothetical protein